MGYDFYLIKPSPERDRTIPIDYFLTEAELNVGEPSPEIEMHKKAFAEVLLRECSSLTRDEPRFDEIAKRENLTLMEAQKRFRQIELRSLTPDLGITISIYDELVFVSMAWWEHLEDREKAVTEAWKCLTAIQEISGYEIYDIQRSRRLDISKDRNSVLEVYNEGTRLAASVSPNLFLKHHR
jgi:hypothetical protein